MTGFIVRRNLAARNLRAYCIGLLIATVPAAPVVPAVAEKRQPQATVVFRVAGVLSKKSGKGKNAKRIPLPAFARTTLKAGDQVRTRARSRAEIRLGDGVLVRLKENTTFKLERIKSKKEALHVSLRLLKGKILLKVGRLGGGSRVRVRTPTAVAAVRGTTFVVDAQAAKTEIKVLEGTVRAAAVSDPATEIEESVGRDVQAGQEVAAAQGEPLSEPEPIPAQELAQETSWVQEPEMAIAEIPSGEEPLGASETEFLSTPEAGDVRNELKVDSF